MSMLRWSFWSALLCACFCAGLYGGPLARAAYAHLFPTPEFRTGEFSQIHRDAGAQVVLFSTSVCPYCKQARTLLRDKNVAFVDYVIDESDDANAKFKQLGGVGVPLLYIGDRSISGFRESAINDALALLHTPSTANTR